jgi:plasmid stabilization system protein ParE
MSRKVVYSNAARMDLAEIRRYLSKESYNRLMAQNFIMELRAKCRFIANSPLKIGKNREDISKDLQSVPFGNYSHLT